MYYPSSENKGADQLRSYCEADLRLCFRICRLLVFPWGGSSNANSSLISFTMSIFQNSLHQNYEVYSILSDSITFLSESRGNP